MRKLESADYKTSLKPVWCKGCGDYGVLNSLHRALANLQVEPWNTVVVSGIGCSSRLPGYVKTFGFNSVHGRALTIATGIKTARPELTVVIASGDGDSLAIGGNHLMHACRRNLDVIYIMMNNQIYGLTKGQTAPTTPTGDKTKSAYWGNPEASVDPCEFAIGCGATFAARGFSGDIKSLSSIFEEALKHKGFSFVDVISPCITFRGQEQFQRYRNIMRPIPADHNFSNRRAALLYTREEEILSVGILYKTDNPTLSDLIEDIGNKAKEEGPQPSIKEVFDHFLPDF